jgi:hypothetical protein
MVGRRAAKPQVSGALAKVLLERDDGCGWCLGECESSEASIEYRNPASRDSDSSIDSDDLIAVCELCQETEKRSVRFPRGLLVAADKIDGTGFSETVRVALIEYLERRTAPEDVEWDVEPDDIWPDLPAGPDFLLKTPSFEAGIEVKKSSADASKINKMSAMMLKSWLKSCKTLQKKIDDDLEQYQFLVLEREKREGE